MKTIRLEPRRGKLDTHEKMTNKTRPHRIDQNKIPLLTELPFQWEHQVESAMLHRKHGREVCVSEENGTCGQPG